MRKRQPKRAVFYLILKPVLKPGSVYPMYIKPIQKDIPMKNKFASLVVTAQKIDRQHIQLVLTLVVLAMLVLGVGAPNDGGGPK